MNSCRYCFKYFHKKKSRHSCNFQSCLSLFKVVDDGQECFAEPQELPLPELIGETEVLTEEHRRSVSLICQTDPCFNSSWLGVPFYRSPNSINVLWYLVGQKNQHLIVIWNESVINQIIIFMMTWKIFSSPKIGMFYYHNLIKTLICKWVIDFTNIVCKFDACFVPKSSSSNFFFTLTTFNTLSL